MIKVNPLSVDAVTTQNDRHLDEMRGGLVGGKGMCEELLAEGGLGSGCVEVDDGVVELDLKLRLHAERRMSTRHGDSKCKGENAV